MKNFEFYAPTKIFFGQGRENEIPPDLKYYENDIMKINSEEIKETNISDYKIVIKKLL